MSFEVIVCEAFRRFRCDDEEIVVQERPCIIANGADASAFIVTEIARRVFGVFYVGGNGSCLFRGAWMPCLRFISLNKDESEKALQMLTTAFNKSKEPLCLPTA